MSTLIKQKGFLGKDGLQNTPTYSQTPDHFAQLAVDTMILLSEKLSVSDSYGAFEVYRHIRHLGILDILTSLESCFPAPDPWDLEIPKMRGSPGGVPVPRFQRFEDPPAFKVPGIICGV